MALSLSGSRWGDADAAGTVSVRGERSAVQITQILQNQRSVPAFVDSEVLGYVSTGSLRLFMVDLLDESHGADLPQGSFFRIPPTLVHWFHNAGSSAVCVMMVHVTRGRSNWSNHESAGTPLFAEWEDPAEFACLPTYWPADVNRYAVSPDDEDTALESPPTGLFKIPSDVAMISVTPHGSVPLRTKIVHGKGGSIMVASRPGAYHSRPHIHNAEQINVVTKGDNWGYCLGPKGKHWSRRTTKGDIFRFPSMVPHWAWGKESGGSELVEFHVPGLHGEPKFTSGLTPLISSKEELEPKEDRARNINLGGLTAEINSVEKEEASPPNK